MIRELLNRYGVWCRDNHESVTWYRRTPYLAVIPSRKTAAPSLNDDDGLLISKAIARLPAESGALLINYYVLRQTLREIGETHSRSIAWASKRLDVAEQLLAHRLNNAALS